MSLMVGDISNWHVLHRCDNPSCCNPAHLMLGTPADNDADKIAKGRAVYLSGDQCARAKLSNDQVASIKKRLGSVRQVDLAKEFNVGRHVIADISANRSWKGV